MIRTQHAQLDLFEALLPPELLTLNEELTHIVKLLQDDRFMEPFMKRFRSKMGRPTIPMQTFLRMMYLKFRYQLGFESLVKEVGDSLMWRRFCQIPLTKKGAVPHPTTLSKHAQVFGDELIRELNHLLVQKANEEKLIRARKLRVDTTVVETDIHYPTDASLLQDGVRVITRIAKAMKESSTELTSQIKDRSRTIRNKVFSISKVLKRLTQEAISEVRQITGEILDVTQDVVRSGWTLLQETTEKAKSLPSKVINRLLPLPQCSPILWQLVAAIRKPVFHQ
ncbi:transposase [Effusibacillus dendaii]|uniref:Transposase n=1 Tax=Effusibacillus dendaii TaxID=2743772 RepID=A0A7I8DH79_9BACL|nr:transposase [Effusibacillus dendaii]BCJ88256.1 transposase [Effusibacillus dendaii]